MIYISSALKQKEIIDLLQSIDGDITYKHVETKGIKMSFEVTGCEPQAAVDAAKSSIKATEMGKSLYFQVTV